MLCQIGRFFVYLVWLWAIPTRGALMKTYNCPGVDDSLLIDVPVVEAFYDQGRTNLIYYAVHAELRGDQKITDLDEHTNKYTTLHVQTEYMNGSQVSQYFRLCNHLVGSSGVINGSVTPDFGRLNVADTTENNCPMINSNKYDIIYIQDLGGFQTLTSFEIRFSVLLNDEKSTLAACATSYIAPEFSSTVPTSINLIIGLVFLTVVVVNIFGQLFSPFHESSKNYFLHLVSAICNEAYLRHLSPSVSDLLHYLQFAFFNSGLNLSYPAFYQPLMSYINWCGLVTYDLINKDMSSKSISSHHLYTNYYNDGLSSITVFTGEQLRTYGWRNMMLWSLIVLAAVWAVEELIIAGCWLSSRRNSLGNKDFSRDFWKKNLSVLTGNFLLVYYSLFALPFLVLSLYQFYAYASLSEACPAASIVGLVLVLLWAACLAAFVLKYVFNLHVVLKLMLPKYAANLDSSKKLYTSVNVINIFGYIYYQYKPSKLIFIVYDYCLLVFKAIIIACVQSSGLAQVILLICSELAYLIMLLTFKPFYVDADKNSNHSIISVAKILVVFLNIPYISNLAFSERTRSYVAYVQLCIHALLICIIFSRTIATLLDILMSRYRFDPTEIPRLPMQTGNELLSTRASVDLEKLLLLDNLPKSGPGRSKGSKGSDSLLDGSLDTSAFYRQPQTPLVSEQVQSPSAIYNKSKNSDSLWTENSMLFDNFELSRNESCDLLLSPTAYSRKKNVDYSVREADLYRGLISEPESEIQQIWNKRNGNLNSVNPMVSDGVEISANNETNSSFIGNVSKLIKKFAALKKPVYQPESSGFLVSRPKQIVVKSLDQMQHMPIPDHDPDEDQADSNSIKNITAYRDSIDLGFNKTFRISREGSLITKLVRDPFTLSVTDSVDSTLYAVDSETPGSNGTTIAQKNKENCHDTIHEVPEETLNDHESARNALLDLDSLERQSTAYYSLKE